MGSGERKQQAFQALSLAAVALILLFSLIGTSANRLTMAWTARLLAPVELPAGALVRSFRGIFSWIADRQALLATIDRLEAQNRSLSLEVSLAKADVQRREVSDRGEFLIDYRDPRAWWDEVRVDLRGQTSPQPGTPALDDQGLVGEVIDGASGHAWVRLVTSVDSYLPVVVESTRDVGVAVGDGLGGLWLRYVPSAVRLEKGMRIVTSIGGSRPTPGLLVGVLSGVSKTSTPDTREYEITPAAPMMRLQSLGFLEVAP